MHQPTEWRDRYLQIAGQMEAQEQRFQEAERELLRLIARLCVATAGLDTLLDPHLKRLRKAAREGSAEQLIHQADALGDALIKAQEDRARGDLLSSLLQHSRLPGAQVKAALKLWRRLAEAPDRASDKQLDELAALLFATPAAPEGTQETARGGGLIGRLLHRSEGGKPNEILREVIASIQWPEGLRPRVDALRQKLDPAAPQDAWVDVVRQIGDMAASALDRAHQDAEASSSFLAQLSERLQAIDSYMQGDSQRRRASRESGMRLGRAVSDEVGGLSRRMQGEQNLQQLREQVLGVLDSIQGHVTTHLQAEAERSIQTEQQAGLLQKQLEALEQETFELRRQVEESRQMAMRDPLTSLPNRRALEARADEELARWRRFGTPLALAVFDIDDFKQINDVFGHKAGDRALSLIGRILAESLRETDFIARYGGEEFVALLPGADAEAALKVAEMMRKQVENAGMHSRNKPVRITFSAGVAVVRRDEGFEQLFERADQAMYQAKQQGKNRCVLAPG